MKIPTFSPLNPSMQQNNSSKFLLTMEWRWYYQREFPLFNICTQRDYSHPDNVFCTNLLTPTVIHSEVDAQAHPTTTDHFPIVTILELPQDRVKQKPIYNFQMAKWEDILENLSIQLAKIPDPTPLLNDQSFQQAVNNLTGVIQDMI